MYGDTRHHELLVPVPMWFLRYDISHTHTRHFQPVDTTVRVDSFVFRILRNTKQVTVSLVTVTGDCCGHCFAKVAVTGHCFGHCFTKVAVTGHCFGHCFAKVAVTGHCFGHCLAKVTVLATVSPRWL